MVAVVSKTRVLRNGFQVSDCLQRRFFAKVAQGETCQLWVGSFSPQGYGKFKLDGIAFDAHVVSWRIANGGIPVPVGMCVMHSCNNRRCVNPSHLSIGSEKENMQHAALCHRIKTRRGEHCANAVLTEEIVRQVRGQKKANPATGVRKIAKRLGVSYDAIRRVIEGRTWKHVK